MNHAEAVALLEDTWSDCHSCRFWACSPSRAALETARCSSPSSALAGLDTRSWGYCTHWDAFDLDAALVVLGRAEAQSSKRG